MARFRGSSWRSYRPEAGPAGAARVPAAAACRILGLDPGSLRTGWGVLDCDASGERHVAHGCIRVSGPDLALRLRRIYEGVLALVELHRPTEVAIERVFVHRNPDSALKLGQARGVALCASSAHGAPAHEYAPRAVKLAVSGHGGAEKEQVATLVAMLLGLAEAPQADAADALAIALCHAQGRRLAALGAAIGSRRRNERRGVAP